MSGSGNAYCRSLTGCVRLTSPSGRQRSGNGLIEIAARAWLWPCCMIQHRTCCQWLPCAIPGFAASDSAPRVSHCTKYQMPCCRMRAMLPVLCVQCQGSCAWRCSTASPRCGCCKRLQQQRASQVCVPRSGCDSVKRGNGRQPF